MGISDLQSVSQKHSKPPGLTTGAEVEGSLGKVSSDQRKILKYLNYRWPERGRKRQLELFS